MDKKEQVRDFFGRHAAAYTGSADPRSHKDLDRLLELLAPTGSEEALDVGTATGNTALALAPRVARVTGLDLTRQMEAEFWKQVAGRLVANVGFVVGDAEALPFPPGRFDIVTCRRAAHHFPDVGRAVREMARVLRPGGRLGIVDMTAPEDPAGAALLNTLEIARDGSHVRALSPREWQGLLEAAGLQVGTVEVSRNPLPWAGWLYPVPPGGPEEAAAGRLLAAASPAARAQVVTEGPEGLVFLKQRVVLVARRPG